jgi:hypothetical protein
MFPLIVICGFINSIDRTTEDIVAGKASPGFGPISKLILDGARLVIDGDVVL